MMILEPDDDVEILADSKLCPMCGAEIRLVARICRHCGEKLVDGEIHPRTGDQAELYADGRLLVVSKEGALPARCVKCNQPGTSWLKRSLTWHHWGVYFSLLLGVLVYVILHLLLRKTATIHVGLCGACRSRRLYWMLGTFLVGVLALGLCFSPAWMPHRSPLTPWIFGTGIVGFFAAIIVGSLATQCVSCKKITDEYVWLKGVHPDYLESLPEFVD